MSAAYLPATLMLISALLHAFIGVFLKQAHDKLAFRNVIGLISALIVLPFAFIVPLPPAQAWGWLILGAAFHFIYQLSQVSAFERGDMSLVYPVMRGSAPALTAIFAFFILDETLQPLEIAGLLITATALIGFGWPQKQRPIGFAPALGFAFLCGMMIALYSVIDAGGMRISKAYHDGSIAPYIVWFFLLDMLGLFGLNLMRHGSQLPARLKPELYFGTLAGVMSFGSFGLALIAFSLAPVAKMAAMRETSVVFGAVLAVLILKEPFGTRRVALAVLLALGLILMQAAA